MTSTPKVIAVINRKNGARFEHGEVSRHLIEYALNNRQDFLIEYEGDLQLLTKAKDASPEPEKTEPAPEPEEEKDTIKFTREELTRMNKHSLQDLAASFNLVYEGETKEALIDLLLKAQEA